MGVLQRFERRLGGLVEGAFAKVFKGGVEPVEIASALARETDDRRANSSNRVLVPNEFAVELAGGDFARLAPYTRALCDELAEMVREHAAEQRYTFVGPVTVRLAEAADLDIGVFRIRSSVASADPAVVGGRRPRPAAPGTPHLLITTRAPGGSGSGEREYPLDAETTVIGRSVECDIRLNDTGVSRRHGEIRRLPDGQFLYVDAGSTNGSLVNGRAATQVKLVNGDRIELGTAVVEFRREEARGATGPRGPRTPVPARSSPPPGRPTPPPADHRTPPPFDPRQPTPSTRRGTPAPDDRYARPEPGGPGGREPGYRDRPGRDPRDGDYREGPSPRFRDDPSGRPAGDHRPDAYREGPSPRFRDDPGAPPDGYREGPSARFRDEPPARPPARPPAGPRPDGYREGPSPRFRDDGAPARGRPGPTPPPNARQGGERGDGGRRAPGPGREPEYGRAGRPDPGRGHRGEPPRAGARGAGGPADEMYRSSTDPRQRPPARADDGLEALEPLDGFDDAETRLPSRAANHPGDDRRRRGW
ncbi:hypothetical protein BBK14_18325 [Parafrankia soli]|uniref:FHA domain-containing protein n=1 Tax=Parafrankia soli TaxID=2599596 RepID=A0A1S1Q291_9ACTN|nr:DUF3662 and FHA domain-containing protein [Parafrankia soli]OHV28090.1 hypothetical protein BBK14_18325 [Parafrankia soli]